MNYIVITAPNGKSHYLAKQRIGGGYSTIATFLNEGLAKETAALLNHPPYRVEVAAPKVIKGGRR